MKESPPQMSPPAIQFALLLDKYIRKPLKLDNNFLRRIPIALAAVYSNTLGLYYVYVRAVVS